MNGTKMFHGWLICHGWIMDLGWKLAMILKMFANRIALRMGMLSGPLNLEEGELKDEALNSKAIVKGWKGVDEESSDNARTHCSPNDKWEDFERASHIGAYANSNYNPYLDVSRIFNDHAGTINYETQKEEGWFDEQELMGDDDDDIGDLEDYLIQKDPHYYVNDEEEISKERR
ncbi:hypothetical protein Tco_1276396 [Tanacetum coccineum]